MKNNKTLIILGIVLLNIVVVVMLGQSLMGKASGYDIALEKARSLAKDELCSRAIDKYNEAILEKDTLDVRLEMLDVYEKGLDIGEFTNSYQVFTAVTSMVDSYRKEARAYEEACELFMKYGEYQYCADLLKQAQKLNVTSEKIEEYREDVKYQYTKYYSMYTDIQPMYNGMYAAQTEDGYTYLNSEGSPDVKGSFVYGSSFSEGYAFVKATHPDSTEKSFIINKEGERQIYLPDAEISSGVGKGKDKNGNTVYLIACKVGDKYRYYDINGNEMFEEYEFAGRFRNNVAAVMVSEGKWKLINGAGEAVTDKVFSDVVLNEFDECAAKGFIFAAVDGKYSLYDYKMNLISQDFVCDDAKPFVDDYAAFKQGDLWGFVDTEGNVVIEPVYEDAKSFSCGMGGVCSGGVWQFVNAQNEVVIDESFEDVDYLTEKGICFVKQDGYWSYLKMFYTEN